MQKHWTVSQYKNYKEKMSKYGNKKVLSGGMKFDSKKEERRWQELLILQKAGEIHNLKRQVKYELQPHYKKNGKTIRAINYIADFTYFLNGKLIVEDTKGYRTEVYKLKKKIFEYVYPDLEIKEV